MGSAERLLAAANDLIEQGGPAAMTVRAACERAGVTAPTLYHHYGDADGLVSAVVTAGFASFLDRKRQLPVTDDPRRDLIDGWDDYVAFAAERPGLYAAMTARLLQGGRIEAAEAARQHLLVRLERVAAGRGLRMSVPAAADLLWASAHAAALLHVARAPETPEPAAIAALRESARGVLVNLSKEL